MIVSDDTSFTSQSESCYAAACDYIARGWAVIPVHGIKPGTKRCTCGEYPCERDNSSAGKHPVPTKWTKAPSLSTADAYAIWMDSRTPRNVGILTGARSGIFALDVDPRHGGDSALTYLVAQHGRLPRTLTMRTGSGGVHYLFTMPAGRDVTNSAKTLPPGLDIRGTGGMIVAPPSISAAGHYEVLEDREPAAAPDWLLDLLAQSVERDTRPHVVIEDLPHFEDFDWGEQQRLEAYAQAVLEQEAKAYTDAVPGTGNSSLFEAACNCLEVVQSPWNPFTTEDVYNVLNEARRKRLAIRAADNGGQDEREFYRTLDSARSKVIEQGRPVPPARDLGFEDPSLGVRKSEEPGAENEEEGVLDPVEVLRGKLLTPADIRNRPRPKPLIKDVLSMDSETWLIGKPGSFKSFVALDWAACIGSGKDWQQRRTAHGPVIYVVAEGSAGIGQRVAAWEAIYGPMSGVAFLDEPIQVKSPQWKTLIELCRELKPVLVVIDTQARVTVGIDENGPDLGLYIEGVRKLRAATGACVLTVHHPGRQGTHSRGHSSVDGAQDTELRVEREDKQLRATLITDKQKNMSDDFEMQLTLQLCELGKDEETGDVITSLAVIETDPWATPPEPAKPWIDDLPLNEKKISTVLDDHGNRDLGNTLPEIRGWIDERFGHMSKSSFYTALNNLEDKGIVIRKSTTRVALEDHTLEG